MNNKILPPNFTLISPLQLLSLLLAALFACKALPLTTAALTLISMLTAACLWSGFRYKVEKALWNNGQSEFGCPWIRRGYGLFGTCYQEEIACAPRHGDRVYFAHYQPL